MPQRRPTRGQQPRARGHTRQRVRAGSVELIAWGKQQGADITAEVTPHHLLLSDDLLDTYDGTYRVNPPLREETDVEALRRALLDGTVDVVATDHAPHTPEDKACEFELARPGMLGLETSLAIIAEIFVKGGLADWRWVAKVMSERPAEITRLADQGRPIAEGEPANLTLVNEDDTWAVDEVGFASKSSNTPYRGRTFSTRVAATVLRGEVTFAGDRR